MKQCSFCKTETHENHFYMYSFHKTTTQREDQKGIMCKCCSDRNYGDKWYPIIGYEEKCEISNRGYVRELRENRYFNITRVQNAGKSYVYLTKNGKRMRKNILPLMRRFCTER